MNTLVISVFIVFLFAEKMNMDIIAQGLVSANDFTKEVQRYQTSLINFSNLTATASILISVPYLSRTNKDHD